MFLWNVNNKGGSAMPKFACVINCIDGRVQEAVRTFMMKTYHVDYVDMITEAGPNKILYSGVHYNIVKNIEKRVGVSVIHHGSKVIAIVAHPDCGGNPADKNGQIEHLRGAKNIVESWGYKAEVVLLWVADDWTTVEEISPA